MGYNTIHESVVSDILDSIKDGVKWVDGKLKPKSPKIRTAGSLARATSGLTLTFPVICTDTLDIETATMISKAIERKNISLLQMAFAAYNITNATDAVSHLAKFHTNMDFDKITVDKFVDIMETIDESAPVTTYPSEINLINEDCKRNCNFVMEDSINTHSLLEFSQVNRYSQNMIIHEEVPNIPDIDDDQMHSRYYWNHPDAEYTDKWEDQQFTKERDQASRGHDRDMEALKNTNQTARDQAKRDFDARQN